MKSTYRAITVGAFALVSGFVLAACGATSQTPAAAAAASTSLSPSAAPSAAPTSYPAATPASPAEVTTNTPRCATSALSVKVGAPTDHGSVPNLGEGQVEVPLVYTNTSAATCDLHGVPGVDLKGPADPNGPVYSLTRVDNGDKTDPVAPGKTATAHLIVLKYTGGSEGSLGSKKWVPTTLITIPPGQTTPLSTPWPQGLSVLRQDSATHPGTYVHGLTAHP
ncbi:DUF4232 domain-containing protein [Amycolatopsis sp. H20-H5]|uniref:DUF4232 domain-containing protein n=1 Tax=Amycolatopsis sp. H20-H5 TaxID=3046309 RepID=UPI002DB676BD|nr:DUF4232 domain-containing protein [Amycolatopsis sp. H20-H5]MEC3981883.1 DUF4232 domain-containing protein [Amycolatopsis sp. H20-H5]